MAKDNSHERSFMSSLNEILTLSWNCVIMWWLSSIPFMALLKRSSVAEWLMREYRISDWIYCAMCAFWRALRWCATFRTSELVATPNSEPVISPMIGNRDRWDLLWLACFLDDCINSSIESWVFCIIATECWLGFDSLKHRCRMLRAIAYLKCRKRGRSFHSNHKSEGPKFRGGVEVSYLVKYRPIIQLVDSLLAVGQTANVWHDN